VRCTQLWPSLPSGLSKSPTLQLLDNDCEVKCVDVNVQHHLVTSGTIDGMVSLWDVRSGDLTWQGQLHRDEVTSVKAVSGPGGRHLVLTSSLDGRVSVFDSGNLDMALSTTTLDAAVGVMASDGHTIVAGDAGGRLTAHRLSESADTADKLGEGRGHSGMVNCLAVSRGARVMATGGEDCNVRVWGK